MSGRDMKVLFVAPSRLSRGDAAIAADLARQLPRKRFQAGFVTSAESVPQLHDLGMPTMPLTGATPEENRAILDRVVRGFRPDVLIATDAFAVNESCDWSGLTVDVLRERYDCPVGSIDRLDWQAADYTADFYGGEQVKLPRVLDACDLVIRTCPPHAPVSGPARAGERVVVQATLHPGGLRDGGLRKVTVNDAPQAPADRDAKPVKAPVVFITNADWEYRNPRQSRAAARLVDALPRVLHSHLAALGRPLRIVHVGPRAWQFPVAEHLEYRHFSKMPYPMFHAWLTSADLYVTTNLLSATLCRAVMAGVPPLVLQNGATLEQRAHPDWLARAAPRLGTAYPFRVAPLGWHDLLEPLLTGNPFQECYATAEIFQRDAVQATASELLDDGPARVRLREGQEHFRARLAELAQPLDVLRTVLAL
jgi:uncharacterized protein DUF6365